MKYGELDVKMRGLKVKIRGFALKTRGLVLKTRGLEAIFTDYGEEKVRNRF